MRTRVPTDARAIIYPRVEASSRTCVMGKVIEKCSLGGYVAAAPLAAVELSLRRRDERQVARVISSVGQSLR